MNLGTGYCLLREGITLNELYDHVTWDPYLRGGASIAKRGLEPFEVIIVSSNFGVENFDGGSG